ncbi:MAG: M48 family metallopeptidase [Betaproteobacteria bacterium]|nr:MAG: M48 family metallopeptidase [Betaproteobacteria bacterium]
MGIPASVRGAGRGASRRDALAARGPRRARRRRAHRRTYSGRSGSRPGPRDAQGAGRTHDAEKHPSRLQAGLAAREVRRHGSRRGGNGAVVGANAFALPSGIIIVTDGLVRLSRSDDEVLGVLAHELGHVKHRHTMRRLLEGSVTALIIAGVTGDVASTTSLAAAAPTVLLQTKYSRDNEREADAYAVQMMRRADLDPTHLARILTRMERSGGGRGRNMPTFLSTHPRTGEREALALSAAGETRQPSRGKDERIDFTGLWKEDCEQLYGLQFKPLEKRGAYSVSLCGPAGCLDPGTYRPNTTVQGDAAYDVLYAEEILIKNSRGDFTSYVKCASEVMPEVPER